LRDIARQATTILKSVSVAIVDERSELAACVNGVPQLDVGSHTDVLDGLPKSAALPWLVRSMAPHIIITDELAGDDDAAAVLNATACGVAVCASVHGTNLQDAATRPTLAKLMSRRVFDLYVILAPEGGCRITALYDRTGNPLELP
jgi:stage III sporulation protein AA